MPIHVPDNFSGRLILAPHVDYSAVAMFCGPPSYPFLGPLGLPNDPLRYQDRSTTHIREVVMDYQTPSPPVNLPTGRRVRVPHLPVLETVTLRKSREMPISEDNFEAGLEFWSRPTAPQLHDTGDRKCNKLAVYNYHVRAQELVMSFTKKTVDLIHEWRDDVKRQLAVDIKVKKADGDIISRTVMVDLRHEASVAQVFTWLGPST